MKWLVCPCPSNSHVLPRRAPVLLQNYSPSPSPSALFRPSRDVSLPFIVTEGFTVSSRVGPRLLLRILFLSQREDGISTVVVSSTATPVPPARDDTNRYSTHVLVGSRPGPTSGSRHPGTSGTGTVLLQSSIPPITPSPLLSHDPLPCSRGNDQGPGLTPVTSRTSTEGRWRVSGNTVSDYRKGGRVYTLK